MRQAIKTYEKEDKRLHETGKEKNQVRIDHTNALVSHAMSWLETDPLKKKELLNRSLTLEKKVLAAYESVGDLHSIGKSCNQLTNYLYSLFWLISGFSEKIKNKKDGLYFTEKAIQTLSKLNDDYELAEAYRSAVWNNLNFAQKKISDEKKEK